MRFGVSWPEGQPEKAVCWQSERGKGWAEFRLGIASWWPHGPLSARRICSSWWWHEHEGSTVEIATYSAEVMAR